MNDVARIEDGPDQPGATSGSAAGGARVCRGDLQLSKQPGVNAADVATVIRRVEASRGYGDSCRDRGHGYLQLRRDRHRQVKTHQKLVFATAFGRALVFFALAGGRP